ncbi:non-ribosomal peptide synthetase [Streptomyces sp. NBC_00525]|uniref:non-ribosomal peptide synthetase n=1 Tax=Streptomyces sp. NBC_00525 TaxID=2903660 RepID=UPI002E80B900|nr:non-ribosomal peptide synthetase [Streptomyces sp. NBC_00525]WUC95729.1 non-ribosomal peptide synthetase [Streptomyces sp. NBC_00525]
MTTQTLTEIFDETAARHPERIAVRDESTALTYRELADRSVGMGRRLRRLGVAPGDLVGIHLERRADLFVVLLGVLRTGAAYVAIDSRYPDARRDLMLRLSGVQVVITESDWAKRLDGSEVRVLTLPLPDVPAAEEPLPAPRPEDAASVLFTSGSTGTPKAIVLEHRNLVTFARNPGLPALTEQDRTGQISSLSFDLFHWETWSSFAAGAEVSVLPLVPDLLAAGFDKEIRRLGITAMFVPTMVMGHVTDEQPDAFAALRLLFFGGDVVAPAVCRVILEAGFEGGLLNLYGPAECTTAVVAHRVAMEDTRKQSVPVGRALDRVVVEVRDPDGVPVGPGTSGELFLGGPQVARGYLGRPDLTAERFSQQEGPQGVTRFYRTGDLVRVGEDGVIDFLGRADRQVKIRGYRVEPGEVDRFLLGLPGVQDVVVTPVGEGVDRRLVAFVVAAGGTTRQELLTAAEQNLPHFMVPSDVRLVDRIPADQHGKRIVSGLLEGLAADNTGIASDAVPVGAEEEFVIKLWEELLGVDGIKGSDSFFTLGGNSLLAFRAQLKIERRFGVKIANADIMKDSPAAELAARIRAEGTSGV